MRLVGKMDDGIVSHGIEDALLLVQLGLEMVVHVNVQIDTSNHTGVECPARKARPPVIRDLHVKAPEQCRPFAVDGEGFRLNARHRDRDGVIPINIILEVVSCGCVPIFS